MATEETIADIARLRHSAWDHFVGGEFLQAFILEWTTTERLLMRMWDRYITNHVEGQNRRANLINNRDLTISLVMEMQCLIGCIDHQTYSDAHAMRKLRNKVIMDFGPARKMLANVAH